MTWRNVVICVSLHCKHKGDRGDFPTFHWPSLCFWQLTAPHTVGKSRYARFFQNPRDIRIFNWQSVNFCLHTAFKQYQEVVLLNIITGVMRSYAQGYRWYQAPPTSQLEPFIKKLLQVQLPATVALERLVRLTIKRYEKQSSVNPWKRGDNWVFLPYRLC